MTLVRWTPRTDMQDPFLRRFFDWADSDLFSSDAVTTWYPRLDLVEEKDRLLVHVELPGIDPKSVEVTLQGEMLTLKGERKEERDEARGKVLKREHVYG